jgi:hypothetical protein
VLILLFCAPFTAQAQSTNTIDEATYWQRLQDTNELMEETLYESSAAKRAPLLTQIRSLWIGITQVRLADSTLIPVDTSWLIMPENISSGDLAERQQWVEFLLSYHQQSSGSLVDAERMLRIWRELLEDGQLDRQSSNLQTDPNNSPSSGGSGGNGGSSSGSSGSGGGSSGGGSAPEPASVPSVSTPALNCFNPILLLIPGIILILGMLAYLARNLHIQRYHLERDPETEEEIPVTSEEADDLAVRSHSIQDYRAAIRYLYLASLLLLDERGAIRYDRALTNREHLRQVEEKPELLELLTPIINVFDHVWYGFAPADENLYNMFRTWIEQMKERTQP